MDYIEAHFICSNYINIFTKNRGIHPPISLVYDCGASSKSVIEDAVILFIAHGILWNTLSEQETENILILLSQLDNFVEDELAEQYAENLEIAQKATQSVLYKLLHRQKAIAAIQFIKEHTQPSIHDCSRVESALEHIVDYKQRVFTPKMKRLLQEADTISDDEYWRRFLSLIADYSDEICSFSDISTLPNDYFLFVSFSLMRDWMDDENLGKYYAKERDYILKHS